jgi:hypothetical protein
MYNNSYHCVLYKLHASSIIIQGYKSYIADIRRTKAYKIAELARLFTFKPI